MAKTIIFMGGSGSGKGTQIELIKKEFDKKKEKYIYSETGSQVRDFLSTTTMTAKNAINTVKSGNLLPVFLPIYFWADFFNKYYEKGKHLILDGSPRTLIEAEVLSSAFEFYNMKPIVIFINVGDKVLKKRMLSRGRYDDTESSIENRINFFNKEVLPTIEFLKNNDFYEFIEVDGDRSIEEINKEIISKVF